MHLFLPLHLTRKQKVTGAFLVLCPSSNLKRVLRRVIQFKMTYSTFYVYIKASEQAHLLLLEIGTKPMRIAKLRQPSQWLIHFQSSEAAALNQAISRNEIKVTL